MNLAGLPGCGEFAQDSHFCIGTGKDHCSGFNGPKTCLLGELEPVLPGRPCELVQIAGLRRDAAVAEVPYRGAGGVVVAFDDGDSQSVGNSVGGMRQADDAGADDDDVDGLAGAVAGG
ncbi:hypothetical protein PJL18_04154 [Paenarthrobacter nicotinovorans]|nr:hypothetical protein [Paenarthrobacter nicotinovorans]